MVALTARWTRLTGAPLTMAVSIFVFAIAASTHFVCKDTKRKEATFLSKEVEKTEGDSVQRMHN